MASGAISLQGSTEGESIMHRKNGMKVWYPKYLKENLVVPKEEIRLHEEWEVDPRQEAEEQGNEDKRMFILDPDNKLRSTYKMINKLPDEVEAEEEENSVKVNVVGYVQGARSDERTYNITKDEEKQNEKVVAVLNLQPHEEHEPYTSNKELPQEWRPQTPILVKKPHWSKVVGYVATEDSTPQNQKYVAVTRHRALLILLWFVIGLALVITIMFGFKGQKIAPPEVGGDVWNGIVNNITDQTENMEQEMIGVPYNKNLVVNEEHQTVDLINPNENCYLNYVIHDEDGDVIYESKWIKENSLITWNAYEALKEKGTYKLVYEVQILDNVKYTPCNTVVQEVVLVKE